MSPPERHICVVCDREGSEKSMCDVKLRGNHFWFCDDGEACQWNVIRALARRKAGVS